MSICKSSRQMHIYIYTYLCKYICMQKIQAFWTLNYCDNSLGDLKGPNFAYPNGTARSIPPTRLETLKIPFLHLFRGPSGLHH